MCLHAGRLELFDHEAPPSRGFQCERRLLSTQRGQEGAELSPGCRTDGAPHLLASAQVDVVECDLGPVNIQATYDPHGDLLQLPFASTQKAYLSGGGPRYMPSVQTRCGH